MDIVNTNRLRITVRTVRRNYGERIRDLQFGSWFSSDHGKPRRERTWYASALGVVAFLKWRPDGKVTRP